MAMTRTRLFCSVLISSALTLALATAASAADPKGAKPAATKNPVVVIKTSLGTIKAEIFADKAPVSAQNFMKYVDDKFYDGTVFHRVIPGFMIQGGGFDSKMSQKKTRDAIKNEASNGLKNEPGTLAMARTSDPNSATAQFFINTVKNTALDFKDPSAQGIGYAVFGKVTEGMDVVSKIGAVKTGNQGMFQDVPVAAVVIESIRRAK